MQPPKVTNTFSHFNIALITLRFLIVNLKKMYLDPQICYHFGYLDLGT